jgi:hypothetical protein
METDGLDAARRFMLWSPYAWGGLLSVLALIYLMARAGTWLATRTALLPLRLYKGDAWTERARRAWPSRRIGGLATAIAAGLPLIAVIPSRPGCELLPRNLLMIPAFALGLVGALQAAIANERRLSPAYALTPSATRGAWILRILLIGPLLLGWRITKQPDQIAVSACAVRSPQ